MSFFSEEHTHFLKSLVKNKVKFIVIGGQASIFYGVERNTGDLDILIEPTTENGKSLLKAFKEIDLDLPDLKPEEFERNLVLTFGNQPEAVDVVNFIPGIEFNLAFKNSLPVTLSGIRLRIMDIADIIKTKQLLKRKGEKAYLDQYDIAMLKKILKQRNS